MNKLLTEMGLWMVVVAAMLGSTAALGQSTEPGQSPNPTYPKYDVGSTAPPGVT